MPKEQRVQLNQRPATEVQAATLESGAIQPVSMPAVTPTKSKGQQLASILNIGTNIAGSIVKTEQESLQKKKALWDKLEGNSIGGTEFDKIKTEADQLPLEQRIPYIQSKLDDIMGQFSKVDMTDSYLTGYMSAFSSKADKYETSVWTAIDKARAEATDNLLWDNVRNTISADPNKVYYGHTLTKPYVNQILTENKDKDFVKRIQQENMGKAPRLQQEDGSYATHKMSYSESGGKYYVYPTVVRGSDNKLVDLNTGIADPFDYALKTNEYIEFDNENDAAAFARGEYKKNWKTYREPKGNENPAAVAALATVQEAHADALNMGKAQSSARFLEYAGATIYSNLQQDPEYDAMLAVNNWMRFTKDGLNLETKPEYAKIISATEKKIMALNKHRTEQDKQKKTELKYNTSNKALNMLLDGTPIGEVLEFVDARPDGFSTKEHYDLRTSIVNYRTNTVPTTSDSKVLLEGLDLAKNNKLTPEWILKNTMSLSSGDQKLLLNKQDEIKNKGISTSAGIKEGAYNRILKTTMLTLSTKPELEMTPLDKERTNAFQDYVNDRMLTSLSEVNYDWSQIPYTEIRKWMDEGKAYVLDTFPTPTVKGMGNITDEEATKAYENPIYYPKRNAEGYSIPAYKPNKDLKQEDNTVIDNIYGGQ